MNSHKIFFWCIYYILLLECRIVARAVRVQIMLIEPIVSNIINVLPSVMSIINRFPQKKFLSWNANALIKTVLLFFRKSVYYVSDAVEARCDRPAPAQGYIRGQNLFIFLYRIQEEQTTITVLYPWNAHGGGTLLCPRP